MAPRHPTEPKPRRGLSRALLYALIPAGFLLMAAFMMLSGRDTSETAAEAAVEAEDTVPLPVDSAPATDTGAPATGAAPVEPAN